MIKRTFFLLGATGNLAFLKLYGALDALRAQHRTDGLRLVGAAIDDLTAEAYREQIRTRSGVSFPEAAYVRLDVVRDRFDALIPYAADAEELYVYLSVAPEFFEPAIRGLLACGGLDRTKLRLLIEKPYGTDPAHAAALNRLLQENFAEEQIFRMDHYLGKPGIQALLACKEANRSRWNGQQIEEISVLLAESVGIEARRSFYRKTGAVIDVLQNHALQLLLLCLTDGGEASDRLRTAEAVLQALNGPEARFGWGQYLDFETETLVYGRFRLAAPPWRGTAVQLLTGKRMAEKRSEIRIRFRDGQEPTVIDLRQRGPLPDYARLLADCMAGRRERFLTAAEAEATWQFGRRIRALLPSGKPPRYQPDVLTPEEVLARI